jgi:hypothetical protein
MMSIDFCAAHSKEIGGPFCPTGLLTNFHFITKQKYKVYKDKITRKGEDEREASWGTSTKPTSVFRSRNIAMGQKPATTLANYSSKILRRT